MRLNLRPLFTRRLGIPFTGLASFLIALIQIMWSITPLFAESPSFKNSPFAMAIMQSGAGMEWMAIMLLSGFLLCFASLTLFRSIRHVALVFSSWVLFSTFPILWETGLRTPLTFTVAILGAYCMVLLFVDVKYKEERKHHGDN